MVYCSKCGVKNDDDARFCVNCGAPLFIVVRGGFKPSEVPEYLGRKTLSIAAIAAGTLIMLFSGIRFLTSFFRDSISCLGLSIGLLLFIYGEHYWSKVTHIMWLRQAFREYGLISMKEVRVEEDKDVILSENIDKMIEGFVDLMSREILKWLQRRRSSGFKLEEVPEYLARKIVAVLMLVSGIILLITSIPLAINVFGLGLLAFIVGGFLAAYGNHYWSKVTIIMWTRQALREYSAISTRIDRT